MLLRAPGESFPGGARDVTIRVSDEKGFQKDVKYRMVAPVYRHHGEDVHEDVHEDEHEEERGHGDE